MAELRVITHSRVLKIAIPVVLSNVTVPILGAVDTGVVGQMGQAAPIGAVGIGAVILTAIYWLFGFLRMGTAGLAAQALGAGRSGEVAALLTRVLMIGLAAGAFFVIAQSLVFDLSFAIAPASTEVESLARNYMAIRIWSAPGTIALYGIMGWLLAQERTGAIFAIQLFMNGLNILLDLLFVLSLGWGVEGVAIATLIAEWSGFALGLWFCRTAFAVPAWRDWPRVFDRARLGQMLRVNTDILIRSLLLELMIVSFLFYGSRWGDVTLAADQVLLQFLHVTAFAMDGFAFAAEALVGQALGARRRHLLRQSAVMTSIWAVASVCVLALAFALAGGAIIDLMATAPEVRAAAREYLPWMVLAPLVAWPAWMLDGIFIGATRTADMRNMMLISALIYAGALALLLEPMGNHGLWAALLISYVARGVTLGMRYRALERQADLPAEPKTG